MHSPADQTLRILVVVDVVETAESLGLFLRLEGYTVMTAHDGLSAIHRASNFQPHVVLLDLGLPEVNGLVVAGRIRERMGPAPTIIAVMGWPPEVAAERARAAGCNFYFQKPVDIPALSRLLAPPWPISEGSPVEVRTVASTYSDCSPVVGSDDSSM